MNSFSKKKTRKIIIINAIISFILVVLLIFTAFFMLNKDRQAKINTASVNDTLSSIDATPAPTPVPTPTPEPTPTPIPFYDATWVGVGDIMSHMPQLPGYYNKSTDSYDFNSVFAEIKDYFVGDWNMANLETPIAGKDYANSGYPTFNAPLELGDALWNAGFNVLSTANNHSLDKGEKGLLRTLENMKAIGFKTVGTYASAEERALPVIIEKNNINMGFLSYTYGTNGIPIPTGKDYLINLIDKETIIEDITQLKAAGADVVTVAMHFGNEYQTHPTEEQKTLARELIVAGADIIAGSHPHVLQPYELYSATDANGTERQGLIIYSMGNFISNQRGETKDYGAVFKVDLRKHTDTGNVEILDVQVTPTWVHRYKPDAYYRYRILPVEETINAMSDSLLTTSDYQQLNKSYELISTRLQSMLQTEQ